LDAADAGTSFGENRVKISGRLALTLVNSAKFGLETQLSVYAKTYDKEPRAFTATKDWQTTEIFVPLVDIDRLISGLVDLKKAGAPARRW
jgi:hypothetical protein